MPACKKDGHCGHGRMGCRHPAEAFGCPQFLGSALDDHFAPGMNPTEAGNHLPTGGFCPTTSLEGDHALSQHGSLKKTTERSSNAMKQAGGAHPVNSSSIDSGGFVWMFLMRIGPPWHGFLFASPAPQHGTCVRLGLWGPQVAFNRPLLYPWVEPFVQ